MRCADPLTFVGAWALHQLHSLVEIARADWLASRIPTDGASHPQPDPTGVGLALSDEENGCLADPSEWQESLRRQAENRIYPTPIKDKLPYSRKGPVRQNALRQYDSEP